MQASEKLFLQTVGRFVQQRINAWTAPLFERLEKIESALRTPVTFSAAQALEVERLIDAALTQALVKGKIATLGDVEIAVAKIPAGPPGKDGTDGTDGTDGKSITAADIYDVVAAEVVSAVASLPDKPAVVSCYIDRAGDLYFTNSSGDVLKAGHVVGADADTGKIFEALKAHIETWPKPKDGKDGFNLDDFSAETDGERTIILRFADAVGTVKECKLVFPLTIYRGVWREGVFQRGDEVTHEGSQWIALSDTATKPGTLNCGWQLACKRGRDGREGKPGQQGAPGKDGRDGRDLTQLGPDGKKW